MTSEEIMAMKPGSDLNVLVAEKVMGLRVINDQFFGHMERMGDDDSSVWAVVKPYSEDNTIAEQVVVRMVNLGYADAVYWSDFGAGKYTRAEAICKAALLAVLEGSDSEDTSDTKTQ